MADVQLDQRELRNVFGSFATGVTVITTRDEEGRPYGLTANSFSSVSLDPPLILWSQALVSPSYPVFREADRFAVSILSEHQTEISTRFAKSGGDKFSGVETVEGLDGIPLIKGASAYLECRRISSFPGGDHAVFLGQVDRMERSQRRPLVFSGGRYMVAFPHDLGAFSIDLGVANAEHLHAVRLGTAAVARLAADLQTTTCLGVWGTHGPTIVRWEESAQPVAASLRTGVVLPVLRSAAGQVFGAFLPREMTQKAIEDELAAAAPSGNGSGETAGAGLSESGSGADPDMVRIDLDAMGRESRRQLMMTRPEAEALLAGVRERRLARNVDLQPDIDSDDKIGAVSAPVFDRHGYCVLAVTALGYAPDFRAGFDAPFATAVRDCAADLSARLGFRG